MRPIRLELEGFGSFRDRAVLDATWHDEHLAWTKVLDVVTEFDPERAAQRHEELVLVFMEVPDELTLETRDLDLVIVERGEGLGTPVLVHGGEGAREVDALGLHGTSIQLVKVVS